MKTDLDVRFGIAGLELRNKAEVLNEATKIVSDAGSISNDKITDDDMYKTCKECRKLLKNERSIVETKKKESVNDFKKDFEADMNEIIAVFDKPINEFNNTIKTYETEEEIGAVKATMTKAANKAKAEIINDSMTLTISCPSKEVKDRIIQFATDLGATIK